MRGVTIRPLSGEEIDAAVALWHTAGLTRPWNDPVADARKALAGVTSTILSAWRDDVLVATAMTGFDGHRAWVYYLAVAQAARGQGLGRALMDAAEVWVKAAGAPKIQLMVRDNNAAAMGFYTAIGYESQAVTVLGRWLER